MENNLVRARDLLPSIIITVLSMIQALALELYWTRIQSSDFLWQGGWTATIGWLQLAVMLLGILQIWIMYVSLMLRFSWLPSISDTIIPFAIGLLEFSLIDLIGPDSLPLWFLVLAAVFSLSIWSAHNSHRQARLDPQNSYYFRNVPAASWRNYLGSSASIGLLVLLSMALWISDDRTWLALAALLFAAAALIFQLLRSRQYWMHTLVSSVEESSEPD